MKSKVIINAQYFENYNVGPEGFGEKPYWKPKGGHQFMIEMDTDVLFYSDNVAETFQKMLDKHESIAERFEYVDYEIQWEEPTVLGTEDEFISIATGTPIESNNVIGGVDFSDSLQALNNLGI